jgi:uncharacterized membrane protein
MEIFKNKYLLFTVLFFGLVYSCISLVNHYNFRTYALDLGVYTNAMYDYIHFKWNDSSSFNGSPENLLADHFDLYLIIFSPLILIFKTYTLLVVQILFILIGGIGVYTYFSSSKSVFRFSLPATIYFYSFFGIFSAVSYDYHSNVIAAMLVPWFFYYFKEKNYTVSLLILIFMLISKENISLWIAFICLGLLGEYRRDKKAIRYLLVFFSISLLYFILIIGVVMPALSSRNVYAHFNYLFLGNTPIEALKYLILHPFQALMTLFINHTTNSSGNYIKMELHLFLLLSGLYVLFLKPHYLVMLIPIYFQKLFNDNFSMWGIYNQYSVEFAPILAIGIFSVISRFNNRQMAFIAVTFVLIGSIAVSIRSMDRTVYYSNKAKIRIYQNSHYTRDYNVGFVHQQLDNIPQNAIVSAQSPFLSHLALRDKIYQFPIIKDSDFIVYSPKEDTYPLNKSELENKIRELLISNKWRIELKNEDLVVLKSTSYKD